MEVYNGTLYVVQGKLSGNDYLGLNVVSLDVNTGQITKTLQFPTATHWIYFYEDCFYSFNTPNGTILPTRINKHDLNSGSIKWSTDLDGIVELVRPTSNYLYFSEFARNVSDWEKVRILNTSSGKTVKEFSYSGHEIRPVVIDSSNKVFYPFR